MRRLPLIAAALETAEVLGMQRLAHDLAELAAATEGPPAQSG